MFFDMNYIYMLMIAEVDAADWFQWSVGKISWCTPRENDKSMLLNQRS